MSPEVPFEEKLTTFRGILTNDPGIRLETEFREKLDREEQIRKGVSLLENRIRPVLEQVRQFFFLGDAEIRISYKRGGSEESIESTTAPSLCLVWRDLPGQTPPKNGPEQSLIISLSLGESYRPDLIDIIVNGTSIPFNHVGVDNVTEFEDWIPRVQEQILLQLMKDLPEQTKQVLEKQLELLTK